MKRCIHRALFAACLIGTLSAPALAATDDPEKSPAEREKEIQTALAPLSPADRALAEAQRFCAVMSSERLGAMGTPKKISVGGKPVFLCCQGCEKKALANAKGTLQTVDSLKKTSAALAKLSKEDRALAEEQVNCPVSAGRLGSMGAPIKLVVGDQPVFICCKGCQKKALANPQATLAKIEQFKQASRQEHDH